MVFSIAILRTEDVMELHRQRTGIRLRVRKIHKDEDRFHCAGHEIADNHFMNISHLILFQENGTATDGRIIYTGATWLFSRHFIYFISVMCLKPSGLRCSINTKH